MVAKRVDAPNRGDVLWITLDPTRGHEQQGRRPVLVVSPKQYNSKIGLALVCPISSKSKGYVFEVPITVKNVPSVVLSDHVRSLDFVERGATKIQRAPAAVTALVQENIRKLVLE